MTMQMVAAIGGVILLLALGALAAVNQLSDNETSGFTGLVGAIYMVGTVVLWIKAGL